MLQVEGLPPDTCYEITMGEAVLGEFTGEALAQGIDLTALEGHPQQEAMRQIAALGRERHQRTARHRNMWVEVMMQRASYTPEQAQAVKGLSRHKSGEVPPHLFHGSLDIRPRSDHAAACFWRFRMVCWPRRMRSCHLPGMLSALSSMSTLLGGL